MRYYQQEMMTKIGEKSTVSPILNLIIEDVLSDSNTVDVLYE